MVLLFSLQSLFGKLYSQSYTGPARLSSPAYSVSYGLLIALFSFVLNGFVYHPEPLTLVFGGINAGLVFLYNLALLRAADRGPFSFVMICNLSGGVLIPLAVSLLPPMSQRLSVFQWIGLPLILTSFVLLNLKKEDTAEKKKGYLFWCILLGLFNGAYSAIMALQATLCGADQRGEMVITANAGCFVLALIYLSVISKGRPYKGFQTSKKSLTFAVLACVVATVAANLILYLLSQLNATLVNATNGGGILVCSVLFSFLLFRERLNRSQWIGVGVCLIAIVFLNLA